MNYYRLKKEALQFFREGLATKIGDSEFWEHYNVDVKSLEIVEEPYISYGIKSGEHSCNLAGWSNSDSKDKGSHFCFTIHFPSTKYHEHDQFSKGRNTRELMERFQDLADSFYKDFSIGE